MHTYIINISLPSERTLFRYSKITHPACHFYSRCQLCRTSKWACNQWIFFQLRPSSSNNTSFRLSVGPSVTPFWQCFCHRIILKISGVITIGRSDVHAKGQVQKRCPIVFQGHPSNFKVTRLKKSSILTQIGHFRTVTPVWIHQWLWNDAQSLKQHRRGALLFSKVIHQISRSHGTKYRQCGPELSVSGLQLQFEFTDGFEMMYKAWSSIGEVLCCFSGSSSNFQGHAGPKKCRFCLELSVTGL